MRAYFFTNMYLSSIQNGIQTAHCLSNLFLIYTHLQNKKTEQLFQWAENYQTIIVLNGGDSDNLIDINNVIATLDLPFANFYEGGLGNTLTTIGVIVPEMYYNTSIEEAAETMSNEELIFVSLLKNSYLAR